MTVQLRKTFEIRIRMKTKLLPLRGKYSNNGYEPKQTRRYVYIVTCCGIPRGSFLSCIIVC